MNLFRTSSVNWSLDSKGKIMDKQLAQTLANAVTSMMDTAGQIKDFSLQQAPEVVRQYLEWSFYSNLIWGVWWLLLALILFLLCTFGTIHIHNKVERAWGETPIFFLFLGNVFSILCIVESVYNLQICLQIYLAPKVFLLGQASHLIFK